MCLINIVVLSIICYFDVVEVRFLFVSFSLPNKKHYINIYSPSSSPSPLTAASWMLIAQVDHIDLVKRHRGITITVAALHSLRTSPSTLLVRQSGFPPGRVGLQQLPSCLQIIERPDLYTFLSEAIIAQYKLVQFMDEFVSNFSQFRQRAQRFRQCFWVCKFVV